MTTEREIAGRTAVLFDPHPLWLEAVTQVLSNAGVEVRAATSAVSEALSALEEHRPSVFVTALLVGEGAEDGIACVRDAVGLVPGLKTIVLTEEEKPDHISAAFAAGAVAYVFKRADPQDLASAVRQSFEHSVYFSSPRSRAEEESDRTIDDLTRRELEILRLVAAGGDSKTVAERLHVSPATVRNHVQNILGKLGVHSRLQAVAYATTHRLL